MNTIDLRESTAQALDDSAYYPLSIFFLKVTAPGLIIETVLFGVFCVLFIMSTRVIICRGINSSGSRYFLAATTIMFLASAAHWALDLYFVVQLIFTPRALAEQERGKTPPRILAQMGLVGVNFLISDSIVLWRACVFWKGYTWVIVSSAFLLFASLDLNVPTERLIGVQPSFNGTAYGLSALALSVFVNLWATSLIVIVAWRHRRLIHAYFRCKKESRRTMVEKIMTLLIESGILYSVVWVLYIVDSETDYVGGSDHLLSYAMPQLTGIYPTLVTMLVLIQKTRCDQEFALSGYMVGPAPRLPVSLQFAGFNSAGTESGSADGGREGDDDIVISHHLSNH
ncbi:hypothetical protein OF83DRAFT_149488 [Amylostereum chailletii]|nr:hypothetical protein OF83DRAFT_149488 [Amylostereum chailletii]